MKNRKIIKSFIFTLLFFLCSCGEATADEAGKSALVEEEYDWTQNEFKVGELKQEKLRQVKSYQVISHEYNQGEYIQNFTYKESEGTNFLTCIVECLTSENGSEFLSMKYYMESFSPVTGEVVREEITREKYLEDFTEEGKMAKITRYLWKRSL